MKVAVFGTTGQLGIEMRRRKPQGVQAAHIGRDVADFTQGGQLKKLVGDMDADVVVNAVAYTAVDKAEDEKAVANRVNGHAVGALAEACRSKGIPLIHVSSDYVFDGSGNEPRKPDDQTGPIGAYGKSKLLGEEAVRSAKVKHVILRTSWVFSAHGANFVKTMLRLAKKRDSLSIVSDQIGGPTPAFAIADAIYACAGGLHSGSNGGTYHFAGAPDVSWADFAREIIAKSGTATTVQDIATDDYPTPARRPLNSRLDCESLRQDFGIERPDWREGLGKVLKELQAT